LFFAYLYNLLFSARKSILEKLLTKVQITR
jgi:hypothetical protein